MSVVFVLHIKDGMVHPFDPPCLFRLLNASNNSSVSHENSKEEVGAATSCFTTIVRVRKNSNKKWNMKRKSTLQGNVLGLTFTVKVFTCTCAAVIGCW